LAELFFFYAFAVVAALASLLVIGQRNPVYSVLLLIASFGAMAGLFVLLDAPFLAVIQIIIYAGAIMVLFLFVIMLLNAPREEGSGGPGVLFAHGPLRVGGLLAIALVIQLIWALWRAAREPVPLAEVRRRAVDISSVREIGVVLFTDYGFAVIVTAVLILVATLGAVVMAKREI
jgi:NADH-quinone oxidoreductase subunit J